MRQQLAHRTGETDGRSAALSVPHEEKSQDIGVEGLERQQPADSERTSRAGGTDVTAGSIFQRRAFDPTAISPPSAAQRARTQTHTGLSSPNVRECGKLEGGGEGPGEA